MIAKKKFFGPQLWPQKFQLSWWLGKTKPFMFTPLTKKTDFSWWLQKKSFLGHNFGHRNFNFLDDWGKPNLLCSRLWQRRLTFFDDCKKKVFWGLGFRHRNSIFLDDWEKPNLLCSWFWQRNLTFLDDCKRKGFLGPRFWPQKCQLSWWLGKLNLLCSPLWQRKLTFLDDCKKKKFFWATTLATEISTFLMIGKNQTFYVHGFDFSWWLQKKRFFGASVLATEISTLQVWNSKASMERTIGLLCCLCFLLPSQTSCGPKNFFFWQSSRKVSFLCQRREHKRFSFSQSPRKLKFLWPKLRPQKTFFFCNHQEKSGFFVKPWT